jgi:tetratricopeptide (TPR) repeat protein
MLAMPYELHMRFGRWDEMLAEPEPRDIFPIARAIRHYGRGVSYAAKSDVENAKAEQQKFLAARDALPKEAMFTQNTAADVLAVAENMLAGEILFREGKVDESIAALREAVRREDALRYIEPPDWIQPVRHALGATLVEAGKFAEAEQVYRDDLKVYPENGWSLYGLAGCLRKLRRDAEADAISARFEKAWQHADVKLSSSCYCLPGKK